MGWERQKSTVADLPEEPSLILWFIGGVATLVVGVLLFVLHANQLSEPLQQYNPWSVAAGPVLVWFFLLCLRGWRYNSAFEKHRFESDEATYAQQQWTAWAGRHMAVLQSGVILPGFLTPATLLQAPAELEQHVKQVRRISLQKNKNGLSLLINSVREMIDQLPVDLPLSVALLTDSRSEEATLQKFFSETWQQNITPDRPVPLVEILKSKSFLSIDERLKSPTLSVELILIHQMEGKDRYSDALATLLLASDDVTARYQLSHSARILRPMSLGTSALHDELTMFFSTQTQANSTRCITGDRVGWGDSFSTLLNVSKEYGGSWKADQLHWLENHVGISGPFSPWVMAAFSSGVAGLQHADCLVLSGDEEQSFITTVTTGNQNNDNG